MSTNRENEIKKEKAIERLMDEIAKGEQSGQTHGWLDLTIAERDLGIVNMEPFHWDEQPKTQSLSASSLQTLDNMSEEQFDDMLQKGYDEAKNGIGLPVNEAFKKIREGI